MERKNRMPVSSVRQFVPFSELETREEEQDDEVFGAKKIDDQFSFAPCLQDVQWQCPVDCWTFGSELSRKTWRCRCRRLMHRNGI